MINLEIPSKLKPFIQQAHLLAQSNVEIGLIPDLDLLGIVTDIGDHQNGIRSRHTEREAPVQTRCRAGVGPLKKDVDARQGFSRTLICDSS